MVASGRVPGIVDLRRGRGRGRGCATTTCDCSISEGRDVVGVGVGVRGYWKGALARGVS